MTIRIDDSGWGSPLGGCLIAGLRVETDEFHVAVIPVEQFQGEAFAWKAYLQGAVDATREVLGKLSSPITEPIEICSGYVHSRTHDWLRASGHPTTIIKVEGKLQELIEAALAAYLRGLGFEFDFSTEKYGSLFYKSIEWLKGGEINRAGMDPERVKVAKTGWKTFRFYQDFPYQEAKALSAEYKRIHSRRHFRRYRGGDGD